METFSASLAICAGNSPVPGEFPTQRPVTRSFDVYFDLRPNKQLSKQSLGWWFETLSPPLWRHRNVQKLAPWPPFQVMLIRLHTCISQPKLTICCFFSFWNVRIYSNESLVIPRHTSIKTPQIQISIYSHPRQRIIITLQLCTKTTVHVFKCLQYIYKITSILAGTS